MIKGGVGDFMEQAQKMQQKMQQMQKELANTQVTGQSGAGLVSVIMTGRHDVKQVSIDSSLMTEDKEVLEDLLAAAINDGVQKIERFQKEKMSDMTSGMIIPDGFNIPTL